ncbi:MAG: hypothetical protein MUC85_03150 [Anaerolineales bacterium]|nr:hypothetical protein [Anaerolineales bacterium]
MDKVNFLNRKLNQAYEQAPWRRQMQMIGIILLVVIVVALVAIINLNVTSRAATLGRQIQDMSMAEFEDLDAPPQEPGEADTPEELTIEDYKILIADLEAELAVLTSAEVMRERAEDMGFVKVSQDELVYVRVPGYAGRTEAQLAPASKPISSGVRLVPLAYRESLMDWLKDELSSSWLLRSPADLLLKGVNP